jgi:pimeloyl-ACP methyl ester carboxylesterase
MQLSTSTSGSGPRHVGLVHGLAASGNTWQPLVDLMLATGEYTVTTVDLRGHGTSARSESYAVDGLAEDLVETLPTGLDSVVGHSLGGSVLARAVEHLTPARAIYLDPGFHLALPTTGIRGRLFWAAPLLTLGVAQLPQARIQKRVKAGYPQQVRDLLDQAQAQFDGKMALGIFRDVAFHPIPASPPVVPSTIVLSDDSPAVLPEALVPGYQTAGWDVRRISGIHHDMQLEDPARVLAAIRDVL